MTTQFLDQTVRSHFEVLYRPQLLRFKTQNTLFKYRLELDRFDRFLSRPAVLPDLNDTTVGDCSEWLLREGRCAHGGRSPARGLSIETTRGFVFRVCKLWDFLARKRLVQEFPTLENMRRVKRIPRAWSREQLAQLWGALRRQPGDLCGVPRAAWFCSLLTVMWRTSERPGALLQVTWDMIEIVNGQGWLSIPGEKRKGGRQPRVYHLTPDCVEWLDRIRNPRRERVWPWPYEYEYLFSRYKEILRCANLPHDRNSMFSRIRCSHASYLEAADGDATESLGHSDRRTTQDHYLDPKIVRRDWPGDRLFPLGE